MGGIAPVVYTAAESWASAAFSGDCASLTLSLTDAAPPGEHYVTITAAAGREALATVILQCQRRPYSNHRRCPPTGHADQPNGAGENGDPRYADGDTIRIRITFNGAAEDVADWDPVNEDTYPKPYLNINVGTMPARPTWTPPR